MKGILNALMNLLVLGWFIMAIVLYFRALFHPKYWWITWLITIGIILINVLTPAKPDDYCTLCNIEY